MSRSPGGARAVVLTALVPLTTAGLVLAAGPAGAIPFEGEPDPASVVRVVPLPGASEAGSPLFVSHGYAAVLVPRPEH
jgi:hypothetical protein